MTANLGRCVLVVAAAALLLVVGSSAALADPLVPTPTPQIVTVDGETFTVEARVSYGEAGVIIGLVLVAGVQLVALAVRVSEWLLL